MGMACFFFLIFLIFGHPGNSKKSKKSKKMLGFFFDFFEFWPSPERKQNGSLWGGEFSAKIFLKHWYLQCFPAMKALKPLF